MAALHNCATSNVDLPQRQTRTALGLEIRRIRRLLSHHLDCGRTRGFYAGVGTRFATKPGGSTRAERHHPICARCRRDVVDRPLYGPSAAPRIWYRVSAALATRFP